MYLIIKCQLVLPKIQFLNYINFKSWTWGESGSVPKGTRYTNISYWLSLCVWFPELLFFHFWNSYSEMCILLLNHFLNTIKKKSCWFSRFLMLTLCLCWEINNKVNFGVFIQKFGMVTIFMCQGVELNNLKMEMNNTWKLVAHVWCIITPLWPPPQQTTRLWRDKEFVLRNFIITQEVMNFISSS